MIELIEELKNVIEQAKNYDGKYKDSFYFRGQLSNAISIINFWENPPKGKNFYATYNEKEIDRTIYHLQNSMINPF